MLSVDIICVGKLKERFYAEACEEYLKRLGAFCSVKVTELPEARRPKEPSPAETAAALLKETEQILSAIPKGAFTVAMCIEGKSLSSEGFSELFSEAGTRGFSRAAFIIGGSDGLHESVKSQAHCKLSMSKMTCPHHLARVMLLEQIYRAFCIRGGRKYHK